MLIETSHPFGEGISALCIALVVLISVRFYFRIVRNQINGLDFFLVGFGVFQLLDIVRYQVVGFHDRNLDVSTQTAVVVAMFASLVFVLAGYRFAPFLRAAAPPPLHFSKPNVPFVLQVILPLCLVVMPIHLATYEAQEKTGYLSLIGHSLKAVTIFIFVLYLLTRRRILLYTAILGVFISLTDTSRRAMISVFFPILVLYLDSTGTVATRKSVRRLLPIAASFVALFVFLNYMRAEHDFGYGYVEGDAIQNTVSYMTTLRSIDTFYNTGFIMENFPNQFETLDGSTYASLLVSPIPRNVWPGKPYGLGGQLGYMQMFLSDDFDHDRWISYGLYSLSPGFVGEAYANFGVLGIVLVSVIVGFGLRHYDQRVIVRSRGPRFLWRDRMPYVVFLPAFLLMGRGDFYSACIYSVYLFIILKMLIWFLHFFRRPAADVWNRPTTGTA